MDAVGAEVLPEYAGLREAMSRRRRNRSAPERILQRLMGLDMKMRQYELGKQFCDAVAERHGVALLNRVWDRPEAVPSAAELADPDAWATRMGGGSAAAA
jgi:putative hydrolase